MKRIIFSTLVMALMSVSAFAGDVISADTSPEMSILGNVISVKSVSSKTAGVTATVIELLGGDGLNPTRMALVLESGYHDTRVFDLGIMMYQVKRITFLSKDQIVINYTQDDLDPKDDFKPIVVNRSLAIKFSKNADKTVSDKIEISTK